MRGARTLLGIMLVGGVVSEAHADERPVLLVVESAPAEAVVIRQAVGQLLGAPVVALGDGRAQLSRATVSVALSADGRRAWISYRDGRTARFGELEAPTADAATMRWVAEGVARLVRESAARDDEWSLADEVIDPFVGLPRAAPRPASVPPEVMDPWRDEASAERPSVRPLEPGSSLGRPRPGSPRP